MSQFTVYENGVICDLLVEPECWPGVGKLADTVAEDLSLVTGKTPRITDSLPESRSETVVLIATAGRSPVLEKLASSLEGLASSLEELRSGREQFLLQILDSPFPEYPKIRKVFLIAGSDKRGTIYGMFHFSSMCGVSPLVYFGDVRPKKKETLVLDPAKVPELAKSLERGAAFLSKEPSVQYRGFFINDEWPAFGNWSLEKFGGANAKAYRRIFELLLRLKGNYLWPAMWDSSFWEDGPGIACAQLADELGIIMGTSHHEPLCRAGKEWQEQYQQYGIDNSWSFLSNAEAIEQFWEDGMKRAFPYENVITIGMRGENDSKLLPEDAGLSDNIGVIKKAILSQHRILRKLFGQDLSAVPRMLAIYKEVEDYYFGDETAEGLKDWEELDDVIFLLSDDNYGHLRALPTPEERKHPGGYGMYFHFDYHGSPISYEWVNCSRLTRTWDQMTQAYEAGVRKMWIVNVGDLKEMEYPLCYFMELAYDFEKWGSSAVNRTRDFLESWIMTQFGPDLSDRHRNMLFEIIEGYTRWNGNRSPESMQPGIYHPVHFREGERVRHEIVRLMQTAQTLKEELQDEALDAYLSMIYYPAAASLNLILLYLDAGENEELARRGCIRANGYAQKMSGRIALDERLINEFHRLFDGKWNHMLSSSHTGFRSWDARDWTYPSPRTVFPLPFGKILVGFRGYDEYHLGAHWQDREPLLSDDLTRPDREETILDIDSRGRVSFFYELEYDAPWLLCDQMSGRVETDEDAHAEVHFQVKRKPQPGRQNMKDELQGRKDAEVTLHVKFDDGETTYSRLLIRAEGVCDMNPNSRDGQGSQNRFAERQGYCCIRAEHFCTRQDTPEGGWQVIDYLGREGSAIRTLPPMQSWEDTFKAPSVTYRMIAEHDGPYGIRFYLMAANPSVRGGRMQFGLSVNGEAPRRICGVSDNYYTEWFDPQWAEGVLSHVHLVQSQADLVRGENEIRIISLDPGVILEKVVIYPSDRPLPDSYFGPEESCRI